MLALARIALVLALVCVPGGGAALVVGWALRRLRVRLVVVPRHIPVRNMSGAVIYSKRDWLRNYRAGHPRYRVVSVPRWFPLTKRADRPKV